MKIKVMKIIFSDLNLKVRDTPKLRGAVASKFPGYSLLHHHIEKNLLLYRYPKIQYKIVNGSSMIIGIKEGIDILKSVYSEMGELQLSSFETKVQSEIEIKVVDQVFGDSEDLIEYRFATPWMALNQKNYELFVSGNKESNDKLLKSILIGNILSLSKSLTYKIENRIHAKIKLTKSKANFKNNPMITFCGNFIVNFHIPNYLGLGKSVSRGFGTIKRVES